MMTDNLIPAGVDILFVAGRSSGSMVLDHFLGRKEPAIFAVKQGAKGCCC
jgi:ketol-acid reductoisomerase